MIGVTFSVYGANSMNEWMLTEDCHHSVKATYALAMRAAPTQAPILIQGETGTGKEVLAKRIHAASRQAAGPFVAINCAAMPETMIEAILFGYEKGAFTNAINSYAGKFEQAHLGTLLLDEIAELPLSMQAKLLRVLQEREVERLGAKTMTRIDVRVIAATNQDLKKCVKEGLFRADLYYRLNVITLVCAPLRERGNDIVNLANAFIQKHAESLGKPALILTDEAKKQLLTYAWPGNIRELDNLIHRAVILDDDGRLDENDLALEGQQAPYLVESTSNKTLKSVETEVILEVLRESNGSRGIAAKRLNISPRTLRHKLMKLKQIGCDIP